MDQLGKICQHHWRESLEISEVAKFKSDTVVLSEQRDNSAKLLKFAEVYMGQKLKNNRGKVYYNILFITCS